MEEGAITAANTKSATSATGIPAGAGADDTSYKEKLDYAWKWFSYHAEQRTKMFSFMLTLLGVFAAAIVTAVDKGINHHFTIALCAGAAVIAFIFYLLDYRNEQLLRLGEDVLSDLERKTLFGEDTKIKDRKNQEITYGILWRQAKDDELRAKGLHGDAWHGRHRFWIPAVCLLLSGSFLLGAVLLYLYPPAKAAIFE